jgi:putative hydrolase of the HAD superfamily
MVNTPDLILIDAGGVLLLPRREPIIDELGKIGFEVDPDLIDSAHYAGINGLDDADGESEDWSNYVRGYCIRLGVETDDLDASIAAVFQAFRTPGMWSIPIISSVQGMRDLQSNGIRMMIVSNSNGTVEATLRELEICQTGDGAGVPVIDVLDSRVVGLKKPDRRIFDLALKIADATPESCLMVGDSRRLDYEGALNAGIPAVLLDPYDLRAGGHVPTIRSMTDLAD